MQPEEDLEYCAPGRESLSTELSGSQSGMLEGKTEALASQGKHSAGQHRGTQGLMVQSLRGHDMKFGSYSN